MLRSTENLQEDGYHLWSIQQSFFWSWLCVPLSLSKGVNDTSPAGTQAVLASSSPDALLNSPHPSTLQDCAGKIRSRFLLRFLSLLLPTVAGNSKKNVSLMFWHFQCLQEGGKTWGSQKLCKQRFLFNMVLKRARDLGSRSRREYYSLSIGGCFSQTQNKKKPTPHTVVAAS